MCMNESSTDLTYPPHVVVNGRMYVPVCTPTSNGEYKVGQRWLLDDGDTMEITPQWEVRSLSKPDWKCYRFSPEFANKYPVKMVRNALAVDLKVGMLIKNLRINSIGSIVGVNPLRVTASGHEDGVEMALTDDAEVAWPWGLWQRVFQKV